jgi:hypothetical protein
MEALAVRLAILRGEEDEEDEEDYNIENGDEDE